MLYFALIRKQQGKNKWPKKKTADINRAFLKKDKDIKNKINKVSGRQTDYQMDIHIYYGIFKTRNLPPTHSISCNRRIKEPDG